MTTSDTPETDAETMRDEYDHVDSDLGPFAPSDTVPAEFARKLERERDEARYEAAMWALQRDEAREQAIVMHEQWLSKGRCCENLAEELHEVKQQRDDYKWQLHIDKGEIAEARKMERAYIGGRKMSRPTPETKWYVTEYPNECDFAVTDGNEILVTIIGGNTIGDQCDLASRIAKLPDLERECEKTIDEYQSLQKTFEEWQLKFLSEKAELLHNKDVERDKLFDEARERCADLEKAEDERIEMAKQLESEKECHARCQNERDALVQKLDAWQEIAEIDAEFARKLERERDEARELVYAWESRWKAEVEFADKVSVKRDELLDILRKLLEIIPEPECHDFGHTKEERHAFLEECPVMARYHALIAKAEEAAK